MKKAARDTLEKAIKLISSKDIQSIIPTLTKL